MNMLQHLLAGHSWRQCSVRFGWHRDQDGSGTARPNADLNRDFADFADCSEGINPSDDLLKIFISFWVTTSGRVTRSRPRRFLSFEWPRSEALWMIAEPPRQSAGGASAPTSVPAFRLRRMPVLPFGSAGCSDRSTSTSGVANDLVECSCGFDHLPRHRPCEPRAISFYSCSPRARRPHPPRSRRRRKAGTPPHRRP